MFPNYLKSALRNLTKTKLFSGLNGLGLAIGMAACLLILLYVRFEKSYDRFHPDSDRIYRLRYERTDFQGQAVRFASCCPPAAPLIRERFPEVEAIGRLFRYRAVFAHDEAKFHEERLFYAEPQAFEILKFNFTHGHPAQLKDPGKAFLSQTTARKYFGSENPVGRTLIMNGMTDFQVVGIFQDMPANSHLKADILVSFESIVPLVGKETIANWGDTGFFTYLRLRPHADLGAFRQKLAQLVETEWGADLQQFKLTCELVPQPLLDIHLTSHYMQEYEPNGDREAVNFLLLVALFILIMAWVNYINLSTARSLLRAREVGLRKVVGASRGQLIAQFFVETALLNLGAVAVTIFLVEISLPLFRQLTGLPEGPQLLTQGWFWAAIAVIFLAGVLLSGLYPVLALSSIRPAQALFGKFSRSPRGIRLRKALVSFQFIMALVLITGTIAVFRQISYLQHRDLGFNPEQVLVVNLPRVRDDSFAQKVETFKKVAREHTDIEKSCVVTEVPGRQIIWDAGGIYPAGADESASKNYQILGVDCDFIDVLGFQLLQGRGFSREFPSDDKALLLNETAVRWMGFGPGEPVVGKQVIYWGEIFTIIGVIRNHHQQSPKQAVEPTLFRFLPTGRGLRGQLVLKVASPNLQDTVSRVRRIYEKLFPGNPFDYFFLDDYFNQQYQADLQFGRVFGLFSGLAIFITCLGLLGLTSFMTVQRTKEIGIRKVLGASSARLAGLLVKDFVILILIAFLLALPLTLWTLEHWLGTFAQRMELSSGLFLAPLAIVLLITLATVCAHVLRTATANPVKSLRYE
ncbi:MAG: ABC transporter permease [Desulfurivibrio sp.]|nr:MAG: ABC transporter permease [Desulfurivibrio sp.]